MKKGDLTPETPYAGVFVKKADPMVLEDLEKEGKLYDAPKFEHDYPFCWRCDTPLIYYARESWFIKMTDVRDDLVKNNQTVNWIPPTIGSKAVLVTGLRISRTGESQETDTGAHLFRYLGMPGLRHQRVCSRFKRRTRKAEQVILQRRRLNFTPLY
jgi:hypothetical protein